MPKRGENIYKRKDNRWEGRYVKGYDSRGKAKYGSVYAKTYRDVRKKLAEVKQNGAENIPKHQKDFSCYCDEWLTLCRSKVKESTYVKYTNMLNRHLKPKLGDFLPQELNTVIVEEFSYKLLADGLSQKTVKDILTVLRSVLKYCQRQPEVNISDIDVIYPKERKKEMRILTIEEQTRFVTYLLEDMDTVKFGVLLALLTGMRIGEVCALRWQDISIEEKTIHVHATMQRLKSFEENSGAKTKVIISDTKSTSSNRMIPLTDYAVSLCRQMQCNDPDCFVLTKDPIKYLEPRTLQYRLGKYTAACGLTDVHFHVLRHTFATRCVEVGFEIKSLSEILGHSSSQVTLDRYVHPSLELKRVNMEKLSAIGF